MVNFKSLTVYYFLLSILLSVYIYRMAKAKAIGSFSSSGIIIGIIIPVVLELIRAIRPLGLPPTSTALVLSGIIVLWNIGQGSLSMLFFARNKALDSIREGILIVDRRGRVVDNNAAMEVYLRDIVGEEISVGGKAIEDFLRPWPHWYTYCKNMQEGELVIASQSHSDRRYNVKIKPIKEGRQRGTISIIYITDNTELFMKEKLIITKNKKLETIINTVSDMAILLVTDMEGGIVYKSKAVGDFFPLKHSEEQNSSCEKEWVCFNKDGASIDMEEMPTTRVLKGEKVSNFHYIYKGDREERHFLFNGTPIFDEDGCLIYGVFFNIDITEQVLHRRLLLEKEQLEVLNRLKDKLFTVITHDIRDPLTAVISLTELLEEEKEQYSTDIIEIIDAVKEYIIDTYELIEHLFDWVKSQSSGLIHSPTQLKLSATIRGVLKLYRIHADSKGISIINNIKEDLSVFADREMLEIVLRNLLSNAIKFTKMGGRVTLSSKVIGKDVIISISDTGIGIHREKVEQLFSEAYTSSTTGTTGEKGTGIGLLICREFVRLNGGEIWVETHAGEGSTFYFSVPTL